MVNISVFFGLYINKPLFVCCTVCRLKKTERDHLPMVQYDSEALIEPAKSFCNNRTSKSQSQLAQSNPKKIENASKFQTNNVRPSKAGCP